MISDLPLYFALRRLPAHNFLNVTLSIAKSFRIQDEMTPDRRLIAKAEELESLVRHARDTPG
jgi:hypothetical protein